jgi:hypothetical protein
MVRLAVGVVFLAGIGCFVQGKDIPLQPAPQIRLSFPPEAALKGVRIYYSMIGAFGEDGLPGRLKKGRSTFDIVATARGKPATDVKVIAYLPSCRMDAVDIPVRSQMESRALRCIPLGQIVLHGEITPASAIQPGSKVQVTYLADWGMNFFGIRDGPSPPFHITTAAPDRHGRFDVTVPDLHAQPGLGEGEFCFMLESAHSSDILRVLKPTGDALGMLEVQAVYPPLIRLSPE